MNESSKHWPLSALSSVASIMNMGLPMVMARLLDPNENGIFRIFSLYLLLAPNFTFCAGLINGLYFWGGKGDVTSLRAAGSLLHLIGLVAACVLFFARNTVIGLTGMTELETIVFAIAAFATIAHAFYESVILAEGKVWRGALFPAVFELLRAMAMLSALFLFRTVLAVVTAHAFVMLLKTLAGSYLAWREGKLRLDLYKPDLSPVWAYAAPVSAAAVFDIFLNNSDRILMTKIAEPAAFALYTMGCLAVPPLQTFEMSVNKLLIPMISGKGNDPKAGAKLYRGALDQLFMISVGAAAGLAVFAEGIIVLLFSERYAQAAVYLRLYSVNYILIAIPYDAYFRATGNSRWIFQNAVLFGILSLGLSAAFCWQWGPYGALCGVLLSQLLMRVRALQGTRNGLGVSWNELVPIKKFAEYGILAAVLAAISFSLRNFFPSERAWFLAIGPVFGVVYLAVMARNFFPLYRKFRRAT